MMTTAGRLISVPVAWIWPSTNLNGAEASCTGSSRLVPARWPIIPSISLKYPDQPAATVAAAKRYSRTRFQPTNQATYSPSVA
jgi:hypothetical protein